MEIAFLVKDSTKIVLTVIFHLLESEQMIQSGAMCISPCR